MDDMAQTSKPKKDNLVMLLFAVSWVFIILGIFTGSLLLSCIGGSVWGVLAVLDGQLEKLLDETVFKRSVYTRRYKLLLGGIFVLLYAGIMLIIGAVLTLIKGHVGWDMLMIPLLVPLSITAVWILR